MAGYFDKRNNMNTDIRKVVEAWIRAEYIFRVSDRNYSFEAQEWLLKAEDDLRMVATGYSGLKQAGEKLGCSSETLPTRIIKSKKRKKMKPKVKSSFKQKGLF